MIHNRKNFKYSLDVFSFMGWGPRCVIEAEEWLNSRVGINNYSLVWEDGHNVGGALGGAYMLYTHSEEDLVAFKLVHQGRFKT